MLLLYPVLILAGPMDYLRPYDKFSGDQQKLLDQLAKDKAAMGGASPPPPLDVAEDEPAAAAAAEPEAAAVGKATNAGGGGLLASLPLLNGPAKLPVIAIAAGVGAHRIWSARVSKALDADLDAECAALGELTLTKRIERPSGCTKRAALEELRARKALLSEHVLPQLRSLEQAVDAPSKKPLGSRSSEELLSLNTTLSERVSMCAALLSQYELLGQPPPPGFRAWPLDKVSERLANMTSKGAELREIVALMGKLGGKRMDWSLPEMSRDALRAHAAQLEEQVAEARERREHAEMMGKCEAELWRRKEEAPVALGTLSTDELRALHKKLKGMA